MTKQSDMTIIGKLLGPPRPYDREQWHDQRQLWMGITKNYPSHAAADLALCEILATLTDDPQQIDRVFRESGLMRTTWEKKRGQQTYGEMTIERARRG